MTVQRSRPARLDAPSAAASPLPALRGALLVSLLALGLGGASAQGFDRSPFFEDAEALLRAHGLELLDARLSALEALATSANEGEDEGEEGEEDESNTEEVAEALEVDLRRFVATLAEADPELADALARGVEETVEIAEGDDPEALAASASGAADLVADARRTLVAPRTEDPAFAAALAMLLLTPENGGIGEAFEEAVEGEVGAYAVGWAALERVEALWVDLEPLAGDTARFEITDMLAELDTLFPGPRPPAFVARSDPEEAEGPTQRIAGFLEEVVDADLFPSRDQGRLLVRTREFVAAGCEAYEAGDGALGDEHLTSAGYVWGEFLGDTLTLFAPDPAGEATELFDRLAPGSLGEEEGEGEEEEEEHKDDLEPLAPAEAAEACRELLEQLELAGVPLGV